MSARIRDIDHGFAAMRKRLAEAAKGAGVSVGVHANEGDAQHKEPAGEKPVTVLDVAIWNEFGLGVPERSFLRAWVDENDSLNREKLRRAVQLVIRGEMTLERALELVGLSMVGGIQKEIARGIPPENAAETVKRKSSSTPLIDTGQLRQSITYLVKR